MSIGREDRAVIPEEKTEFLSLIKTFMGLYNHKKFHTKIKILRFPKSV